MWTQPQPLYRIIMSKVEGDAFVAASYNTAESSDTDKNVSVIFATGASLLATAALGLIAFVPLVWLAVLPLQLMAWVLRGLVFQYIGLSSIGAYVKLYREYSAAQSEGRLGRAEITPQVPMHSRS